jgi:hypothetical protein
MLAYARKKWNERDRAWNLRLGKRGDIQMMRRLIGWQKL